jgi:iron complex outermembrane receptor protein
MQDWKNARWWSSCRGSQPGSCGWVLGAAALAALTAGVSLAPAAENPAPATQPAGAATQPAATQPAEAQVEQVTVTAQKVPQPAQSVPRSLTVLSGQNIADGGIHTVRDAAALTPNVTMSEFTARKESFPYFRGIGSGPTNPSVTTYYDGVPQLNANSSSLELFDIDHMEFIRGPQSMLFGRNTLGGVLNIVSRKPTDTWTVAADGEAGNYNLQDYHVVADGPIEPGRLSMGVAGGFTSRDGYTHNDLTGNDVDRRADSFGRGQLLFTPSENWEFRALLSGEHDDDGDYAFGDLGAIRADPYHVSHSFEGYTRRDVVMPVLQAEYHGPEVDFVSVTGLISWHTEDLTNLDYANVFGFPVIHDNTEDMTQFTQEFRLSSPADAPARLGHDAKFRWLVGTSVFTSTYDQNLSDILSGTSRSVLDDTGVGLFGQGTVTLWDRLDLTAGLRYDFESKYAQLDTSAPLVTSQTLSHDFNRVTPEFSAGYHLTPDLLIYDTVAEGYKAGGFNSSAPAGAQSYNPETDWSEELGIKTQWLHKKLQVNACGFYIDWQDMQLTQFAPPAQQFTTNAGAAHSAGAELEAIARPLPGWDIFAGFGYVDAEFNAGSTAFNPFLGGNSAVAGNVLPFAPHTNWHVGTQESYKIGGKWTVFGRAAVTGTGRYFYDATNGANQGDYVLADFRLGVRRGPFKLEGWIDNALGTNYVPLAIPYPGGAASGYIGENGPPRTYGLSLSVAF